MKNASFMLELYSHVTQPHNFSLFWVVFTFQTKTIYNPLRIPSLKRAVVFTFQTKTIYN